MSRRHTHAALGIAVAAITGGAWAEESSYTEKQPLMHISSEWQAPAGAQTLPSGMRRTTGTTRMPAEAFNVDGKNVPIDPATGEALLESAKFFLPDNWQSGGNGDDEHDSFGRPIVSRTIGLPAWSQYDVDALRDAIVQARGVLESVRGGAEGVAEAEGVLGNFIGQAIVRGIQINDLVDLNDAHVVTPGVAASAMERMHAYELTRSDTMTRTAQNYTPADYPAEIVTFVESRGSSLAELQSLETPGDDIIVDRSVPGGCYIRVNGNGYGLNVLSGATTIWEASDVDDASADIPIGFPFNFYECEDETPFTGVRVSTNGYLTFYQHGGNAANGTAFSNMTIGDANGPNGFIAGYWDDFEIINQSAFPDKVSWKIEGAPGGRTLTVEWFSVSRRGGSTIDYHTFQIILEEYRPEGGQARSIVTLAYGELGTYWQADPSDNATVGMEAFSGTNGDCIDTCSILTNIPSRNFIFRPVSNDLCSNALPLNVGGEIVGDLMNSTSDTPQCSLGNGDQWYFFDAPSSGMLTVDTCGTNDNPAMDQGVDTLLAIWIGCPSSGGSQIVCDDDGATSCQDLGNVRDSRASVSIANGDRVYVRISSFNPSTNYGLYMLHAHFVPNQLASNDNCQNALQFFSSNVSTGGNLINASNDGSASCGILGAPDLWWKYLPQLSGTLYVNTCGTNDRPGVDRGFDTVLSLHSGCPGVIASEVACNDDSYMGCGANDDSFLLDSVLSRQFNAGDTAMIRVSSFGGSLHDGYFNLHMYFLPADLTGDCRVDLTDLATLLTNFGSPSGESLMTGDVDADGDVDLTDLANLLSRFGLSCE